MICDITRVNLTEQAQMKANTMAQCLITTTLKFPIWTILFVNSKYYFNEE